MKTKKSIKIIVTLLVGASALVLQTTSALAETREFHQASQSSSRSSIRSSTGPNGSFCERIEDIDQSLRTLESERGNDGRVRRMRESYDALRESSRDYQGRGSDPRTGRAVIERFSQFQRDASGMLREEVHTPGSSRFFEDVSRARDERASYQLRNSGALGLSTSVDFLHSLSELDHESRSVQQTGRGRTVVNEVSHLTDEALDLHLQGGALKFDHSFRNRLSSVDRSLRRDGAFGSDSQFSSMRDTMSEMRTQWSLDLPELPRW